MLRISLHWILSHEQKTKKDVTHVVGPSDKAVWIISLVDRNYKYLQLFPTEEVSCPMDADISLHFSRFNYHSFCVNVKIMFRTIDSDKEILFA